MEVIIHPTLTGTLDREVEQSIVISTAAVNQCYVIDVNGLDAVSYTHLTLPTERSSVDLGGRRIITKTKHITADEFVYTCDTQYDIDIITTAFLTDVTSFTTQYSHYRSQSRFSNVSTTDSR